MVKHTSRQNQFPPGWDEKKVREVIAYYDAQTEEEAAAEIEAAFENQTMMAMPNTDTHKSRKSSPRNTRRT